MPPPVKVSEVKRSVNQCELRQIDDDRLLLARHPRRVPSIFLEQDARPYERLLGAEPERVYPPLLLRPCVGNCTDKEGVQSGKKVTLAVSERNLYYVLGGNGRQRQIWCRKCCACEVHGEKAARFTLLAKSTRTQGYFLYIYIYIR